MTDLPAGHIASAISEGRGMTSAPHTPRRSRRSWPWFAAFAVFTALGLIVLEGSLAGVATLIAVIALLVGAISALAGEDVTKIERTGIGLGG